MNENELKESNALVVQEATELSIQSPEDYENAGKILVDIKAKMKQVKNYWAEPKKSAKLAHDQICEREKTMLKPLTDAEAIIKKTMLAYQTAVEKARKQELLEARRRQQEEADRLLADAVKAQESGDEYATQMNLAMAQMVNEMAPIDTMEMPTAKGTSIKTTWKARVVNPALVPAYVNGMEIREISMSALNRIAKMSEGQMKIDGVEFYLDSMMSVRA